MLPNVGCAVVHFNPIQQQLGYSVTLFGLTLLSHQIGGFLGAWLGGLSMSRFGDFTWMLYADLVLAAMSALLNLPIHEECVRGIVTAQM